MTKDRLFRRDVTNSTMFTCPLCRASNAEFWSYDQGGVRIFEGWCPACTNVRIPTSTLDRIRAAGQVHLLSAALRDLPSSEWRQLEYVVDANVQRLMDSVSEVPVVDQFDRLLFVICERTERFGSPASFSYETDWPLIRAKDSNEVLAMLKALKLEGYLQPDGPDKIFGAIVATRKALERYAELRNAGPLSQQAFVAMWFAPERDFAWHKIIKPGIEAAGYRPYRVDQKEHADKIDDLIMAEIRRSKFLVADFTGQRGGVYFEAGFAHGLGRPVIWMCSDDERDKLHFDTRQYNHILYSDPALAQSQLKNRIIAIMGEGTYQLKLDGTIN